MSLPLESVRAETVPHLLARRLAAGRAVEVLTILKATGTLPPGGTDVLLHAAKLVRPGMMEPKHVGRSLGESADQMNLLVAATEAFETSEMSSLLQMLTSTAVDLERLAANPKDVAESRIDELLEFLARLRRSLAASRTRTPEERPARGR